MSEFFLEDSISTDDLIPMLNPSFKIIKEPKPKPNFYQRLFRALKAVSGWSDAYLTAVIFINISCAFDMFDNILSKAA